MMHNAQCDAYLSLAQSESHILVIGTQGAKTELELTKLTEKRASLLVELRFVHEVDGAHHAVDRRNGAFLIPALLHASMSTTATSATAVSSERRVAALSCVTNQLARDEVAQRRARVLLVRSKHSEN